MNGSQQIGSAHDWNDIEYTIFESVLQFANSSLSFLSRSLGELYLLFIRLQSITLSNKYEDRDVALTKVQILFEVARYSSCERFIRSREHRYPEEDLFLRFYLFLCQYKRGFKKSAMQTLRVITAKKPHLVSCSRFMLQVIDDEEVRQALEEKYSEAEIAELRSVVQVEDQNTYAFIQQAQELKAYFSAR